jgi:radical SAM/Cys-rich protein
MSSTAARESSSNFQEKVLAARGGPLAAEGIEVLQVNLGFRCNMACKHCHVEAGPARGELMGEETAERVISVLAHSDIPALDLTGGAPELNPQFRMLVAEARRLEKRVIARSNLTIFFEEGMEDLPEFYAEHGVEVVASLPYYMESGVDRVRGEGTFRKSIEALRKLNSLGFGADEGGMLLNLVYNPPGAFLPPAQETLEGEYKRELGEKFGISFSRLFTFTNMHIGRFREFLAASGYLKPYTDKLVSAFNPATLDGLMCRHLLSVGWDGSLYDCDFNLVLGLKVAEGCPENIGDFDLRRLSSRRIAVGDHCFGCTAGQGST